MQLARQPGSQGGRFLLNRVAVGENTLRPDDESLAFRRQSLESVAAPHEWHVEFALDVRVPR